jgi:hypothetical protein
MSLPAMLRLLVSTFLVLPGLAGAAPVSLDCSGSGPAGTVTFRLIFDEAAKQISTVWAAGGGRPHAQWYGEAGADRLIDPGFSATGISGAFRASPYDDPAVYMVNVNRTNGSMQFTRYGPIRNSQGTCSPSATPSRIF